MRPVLCGLSLLTAALPAQIFTATATTATPLTTRCSVPNEPPNVMTVPSGRSVASVHLNNFFITPAGGATAFVDGRFDVRESLVQMTQIEMASGSLQGTGVIEPHDCRLVLQASVPTPIRLVINWSMRADPGVALPAAQVDVGDDGVVDFVGLWTGQSMTIPLVVGSQPLVVRTRMAMTGAQGNVNGTLTCTAFPAFRVTSTPRTLSCAFEMDVYATFQHELVLSTQPLPGLQVAVVGFQTNAVPVPLSGNCVLGPVPEIVAPLVNGRVAIDLRRITVRPLTFFAQCVTLTTTGLLRSTETDFVRVD